MFTCSLADGGGWSKVKVSSSLIFSRMNINEFIEPAGRHN